MSILNKAVPVQTRAVFMAHVPYAAQDQNDKITNFKPAYPPGKIGKN